MSDTFQVTTSERGLIRLFSIDLPPEEIDKLRAPDLARSLGVETLDIDQVDLFSVSDLKGLGLVGYMTEGLGIAEADLADDRTRLEALKGPVLIVRSAAFKGQYAVLTSKAPLRWIGTYPEEQAQVKFEPLPDAAAQGTLSPSSGAAPDPGRRSRGRLLAFIAAGLVVLISMIILGVA